MEVEGIVEKGGWLQFRVVKDREVLGDGKDEKKGGVNGWKRVGGKQKYVWRRDGRIKQSEGMSEKARDRSSTIIFKTIYGGKLKYNFPHFFSKDSTETIRFCKALI